MYKNVLNKGYLRAWILLSFLWLLAAGYILGLNPYLELRDKCCVNSDLGFCVISSYPAAVSKRKNGCVVIQNNDSPSGRTTYTVDGINKSHIFKDAEIILLPPIVIPVVILGLWLSIRWVINGFRD